MMSTNPINYSIIIPHKDIPELLRCCLDSIPHNPDVEIIIVDDHSSPDKVDFDKFPGLGEKNTKIIFTKEGKGAGFARNLGINHAQGKWIVFADADDQFTEHFSEAMRLFRNDSTHEIIYFKTSGGSYDANIKEPGTVSVYNRCFDEYERGESTGLLHWTTVVWAKFIRRDFIVKNNIQCDEVSCCDDTMFALKSAIYASNICTCQLAVYKYFYRNNSSWNDTDNIQRLTDRLCVTHHANKFRQNHGIKPFEPEALGNSWMMLYGKSRVRALIRLPILLSFGLDYSIQFLIKSINYRPTIFARTISSSIKRLRK